MVFFGIWGLIQPWILRVGSRLGFDPRTNDCSSSVAQQQAEEAHHVQELLTFSVYRSGNRGFHHCDVTGTTFFW